jgi:hypothetical protein
MIVRIGGQIINCTPETILPGNVTPQELFDRVLEKRFDNKVAPVMSDPDSMTDAERAAWWESEYRRLAKEDLAAREALAKILRCPAAWRYLMPEILKRIQ